MSDESAVSDRGFKHYSPVESTYGAVVRVYESSAASGPHLWLNVDGEAHLKSDPEPYAGIPFGVAKGSVAAHLTLDQAREVRDALDAAIRSHYQLDEDDR